MKTVLDITKEKETLLEEFKTQEGFTEHELNKARRKAEFLTKCLYYLDGNPSEKGLREQADWLSERLKFINEGFDNWLSIQPNSHQIKNPEAKYRADMREKELRAQLKSVVYLLS